MNKAILSILLMFTINVIAQDNWCGTDAKLEAAYEANPDLRRAIGEHMAQMHQNGVVSDRSDSIIIPVVFHVIHDNGIGNISHAQILDAMRMLNEDFNRTHADTIDTRNTATAPFAPVASNVQLCFELAKIDPNGNCTNGVQRRNSAAGTYDGSDNTSKSFNGGGLSAWNRSRYFNIWVVNSIGNSGGGITLGYAQFPYFGSASTYGVIIRHDRVGSIGTATSGDRTLTHELGHCLGLFHTFQDGCGSNNSDCGQQGDYCCDTPPVDQAHWSCSVNQNFCSQVPNNDHYGFDAKDQFENFMSYSPCQNMFSQDQKNIIENNFATYSWLGNLGTAGNLLATGVSLPGAVCEADFIADKTVICAGDAVEFSDLSYSGVTSRSWSFSGGSPASGNDSLVSVTYNTPGNYTVAIDVTDGLSNVTETKTSFITVLPAIGLPTPVQEGFETVSFPDNSNFFSSTTNNITDWELTTGSAALGAKSVFFDNFNKGGESITASFESGPIDLSGLDPSEDLVFTFDYAYKKKSSSNNERLRVFVSDDCGETWSLRKQVVGSILGSDVSTSAFQASSEDFSTVEVTSVTNSFFVSNFRYKFEFQSDEGNNIFIDNINIFGESALGLDLAEKEEIVLYPNPVSDMLNVDLGSNNVESFQIVNTNGQTVMSDAQPILTQNRLIQIDTEGFAAGIYYITVIKSNQLITKKFIKH